MFSLSVWVPSHSIIFSSFVYLPTNNSSLPLNSSPLCICASFSMSPSVDGHSSCSHLLAVVNREAVMVTCHEVVLLGHVEICLQLFWESSILIFRTTPPISRELNQQRAPHFLHPLQHLFLIVFLILALWLG